MDLIELVRGKKVMVGAIDVATDSIETPEQVAPIPAQRPALRRCGQALPGDELRHGAFEPQGRDRQVEGAGCGRGDRQAGNHGLTGAAGSARRRQRLTYPGFDPDPLPRLRRHRADAGEALTVILRRPSDPQPHSRPTPRRRRSASRPIDARSSSGRRDRRPPEEAGGKAATHGSSYSFRLA